MNLAIIIFGVEVHFCADELLLILAGISGVGSSTYILKHKWQEFKMSVKKYMAKLFNLLPKRRKSRES